MEWLNSWRKEASLDHHHDDQSPVKRDNSVLGHLSKLIHELKSGKRGQGIGPLLDALLPCCCHQPVKVNLSHHQIKQGETLSILVAIPPCRNLWDKLNLDIREKFCKTPLVQVTVGLHDLPAYQILGNPCVWRSLFPTTPLDDPGPQSLSVVIRDGRHKKFNGVFEVVQTDFPLESLWFNDTKSSIRGTEKELAAVQGFVSNQLSVQYWDGPFVSPASEGEVTMEYGVRRYYNGTFAERYFHQGMDYGVDEGTPVRAPATGCVTLIGREKDGFELHGNCVGIDHGQGVTSILMHLSSVCIKEGTMVQAGDIVGKVGETGLATGPHLHWGLFVNGKAVNPNPWLQKGT